MVGSLLRQVPLLLMLNPSSVPVQSGSVKKVTLQSEAVALVPSVPSTVKKTLLLSGTARGTHVDWV